MIVRSHPEFLQFITQPDHARLAGRLMEHCVPLADHPRRGAILHAIAEHDTGWADSDAAPTVNSDNGQPFDFMSVPLEIRQGVWPRSVARLSADPWAAALVAQHAITVYDRFRPDAAWTSFFAGMESQRDAMRRASSMPVDALLSDYVFVRLGDLLSLTFCTGWTDAQQFGGWTIQRSDSAVVVAPDAFGGRTIPIEIAAKEIRRRTFQSDRQLQEALSQANAIALHGAVAGTTTR